MLLILYTDSKFLSKTQLVMIDQMQDVSTRRCLSTAYRQVQCMQLTKTSGSKRPAFDLSLPVVSCSRICISSLRPQLHRYTSVTFLVALVLLFTLKHQKYLVNSSF